MPIHVLQHPLGKVHLSVLRDKSTDPGTFRTTLKRLASLVGLEATASIQLKEVSDLQSPWASYTGYELGERVGLAPILRSGVGMEDALLSLLPGAPVYHLGLYRDPISLQAIEYYSRLPQEINVDRVFILDPMVATGNTALAALKMMKEWGLEMNKVSFLGIIGSKKALEGIEKKYPEVEFYFAAVDEELTDKGYVIPGCGDVGDRLYNSIK